MAVIITGDLPTLCSGNEGRAGAESREQSHCDDNNLGIQQYTLHSVGPHWSLHIFGRLFIGHKYFYCTSGNQTKLFTISRHNLNIKYLLLSLSNPLKDKISS